jgi:uncharacterized protein
MELSFDETKRQRTLSERGLDFAQAEELFSGLEFTFPDDRNDYGEERYNTFGLLGDRLVVVVWTIRDDTRRIISMRKANEREKARYQRALDRPG